MRVPRDPSDVHVGYVHVLCKGVRADRPHAVAWCESWQKENGRKYARRPSHDFYRRGCGGNTYKVLPATEVSL